jgi:hypothetical protein
MIPGPGGLVFLVVLLAMIVIGSSRCSQCERNDNMAREIADSSYVSWAKILRLRNLTPPEPTLRLMGTTYEYIYVDVESGAKIIVLVEENCEFADSVLDDPRSTGPDAVPR